jgi:hypothetical protein
MLVVQSIFILPYRVLRTSRTGKTRSPRERMRGMANSMQATRNDHEEGRYLVAEQEIE